MIPHSKTTLKKQSLPADKRCSDLSVSARVDDLLARMTPEEKARQLDMFMGSDVIDHMRSVTKMAPHGKVDPAKATSTIGEFGCGVIHRLLSDKPRSLQRSAALVPHQHAAGYSRAARRGRTARIQPAGQHGVSTMHRTGRDLRSGTGRAHRRCDRRGDARCRRASLIVAGPLPGTRSALGPHRRNLWRTSLDRRARRISHFHRRRARKVSSTPAFRSYLAKCWTTTQRKPSCRGLFSWACGEQAVGTTASGVWLFFLLKKYQNCFYWTKSTQDPSSS